MCSGVIKHSKEEDLSMFYGMKKAKKKRGESERIKKRNGTL
jgi:hypothetical protein